jgi:hypothetical protein
MYYITGERSSWGRNFISRLQRNASFAGVQAAQTVALKVLSTHLHTRQGNMRSLYRQ